MLPVSRPIPTAQPVLHPVCLASAYTRQCCRCSRNIAYISSDLCQATISGV